jgi:hypothetical protein
LRLCRSGRNPTWHRLAPAFGVDAAEAATAARSIKDTSSRSDAQAGVAEAVAAADPERAASLAAEAATAALCRAKTLRMA